jgi:hypothetical protein
MKRWLLLLFIPLIFSFAPDIQEHLDWKNNVSIPYDVLISKYKQLANAYPGRCVLREIGETDDGSPLFCFYIHPKNKQTKLTTLINNGIHPGEPEGMDASLLVAQRILSGKIALSKWHCLAIIPCYNIEGSRQRSCCSRANQAGL